MEATEKTVVKREFYFIGANLVDLKKGAHAGEKSLIINYAIKITYSDGSVKGILPQAPLFISDMVLAERVLALKLNFLDKIKLTMSEPEYPGARAKLAGISRAQWL